MCLIDLVAMAPTVGNKLSLTGVADQFFERKFLYSPGSPGFMSALTQSPSHSHASTINTIAVLQEH